MQKKHKTKKKIIVSKSIHDAPKSCNVMFSTWITVSSKAVENCVAFDERSTG